MPPRLPAVLEGRDWSDGYLRLAVSRDRECEWASG